MLLWSPAMLRSGEVVDRYTVQEVIGQGGMGRVYRAHDDRLDRRVALKVIADGGAPEEARARLLREARAAAALDHPNAVAIFDVGEVEGSPYVVMELVAGRTLREAVSSDSIPASTRMAWLLDVGRALGAAHKRGLVHRDIKPENVMVRDDGVVKVLDFGIARSSTRGAIDPAGVTPALLPTLTRDGVSLGTPAYMAPEQIKGEPLDGRTDQFAWGVLAYELLTGRLPWRGSDPLAAAASIVTDEPDPQPLERSGASASACAAILRALAKRPTDRFDSMEELLAAVERPVSAAEGPADEAERSPSAAADTAGAAAAASTTTSRQYSSGEMRQILARAVERQAEQPGARISFDDLLDAAREVGVEEAVLRDASREIRARDAALAATADDDAEFAVWRRRQRRGFWRHLAAYLAVNGALLLIGLLLGKLQLGGVALFWGIGLVMHAFGTFTASRDDWDEKQAKRKRRLERRRQGDERQRARERHHEEVLDRVIEEGASLLLAGGRKLRERFGERRAVESVQPTAGVAPTEPKGEPARGAKLRIEPSAGRTASARGDADAETSGESLEEGSAEAERVARHR